MAITEQKPNAGELLQQLFMETAGHGGSIDPALAREHAGYMQTLLKEHGDTGKIIATQLQASMK